MAPSPLSARSFFRDPLGYVQTHGDGKATLRLAAGRAPLLLVRDAETVWRVLVTDAHSFRQGKWKKRARRYVGATLNTLDGEDHRRRRLLLQPAFDRRRIATFASSIVSRAERAQGDWKDGASICLRDTIDPLAVAAAGDVLLSADLERFAPELAVALARVTASVPKLTPPFHGLTGGRALARTDRIVRQVIAERRASGATSDDALGALLRSGLPERAIRGEVIALLLACADEPPSALEAAWYLLGRNPDAEARLHAELDANLGEGPVTAVDETRLPYLGAVLRETLRLFPPTRHIDRCPVTDLRIGDVQARAGSNLLLSPLVTHHDPRLFDRPSQFVPERWLEAEEGARNGLRGSYLPFGAGAHTCIAEALARSMMTRTIATIAGRWRLNVAPDTPPPVPRTPRLVVRLERR